MKATRKHRILVIACGNPLRGDDGLGPEAARQLAQRCPPQVMICQCHQLTPDLIEPISEAELVIFIDAACDHGVPGQIRCTAVADADGGPWPMTHHANPSWLLACCQSVYGLRPQALVFSVTTAAFDYGQALSEAVASALPVLVERVAGTIAAACAAMPARRPSLAPAGQEGARDA